MWERRFHTVRTRTSRDQGPNITPKRRNCSSCTGLHPLGSPPLSSSRHKPLRPVGCPASAWRRRAAMAADVAWPSRSRSLGRELGRELGRSWCSWCSGSVSLFWRRKTLRNLPNTLGGAPRPLGPCGPPKHGENRSMWSRSFVVLRTLPKPEMNPLKLLRL